MDTLEHFLQKNAVSGLGSRGGVGRLSRRLLQVVKQVVKTFGPPMRMQGYGTTDADAGVGIGMKRGDSKI